MIENQRLSNEELDAIRDAYPANSFEQDSSKEEVAALDSGEEEKKTHEAALLKEFLSNVDAILDSEFADKAKLTTIQNMLNQTKKELEEKEQ